MKRLLVLLLVLALPSLLFAAAKTQKSHMKTDAQECSDCHAAQDQAWLTGKHGLMNVKCVVCHGSPEENFSPKPGLSRCRGCHGEKVEDVETKLPAKDRTCFLCHDQHTVAIKDTAKIKAGFHGQGGVK